MDVNNPSSVQLVFDTNILVDAMLARGRYFQYAVQLLEDVRDGRSEGWVAPHCLTTVYYLVERSLAQETDNRRESDRLARTLLEDILNFLKPLPQIGNELTELDAEYSDDLEDQLIVALSQEYLPNPLIVTRDKWFLNAQAFAAHPKEIIKQGLHSRNPEDQTTAFIDLSAQQRVIRPALQKNIHTVLRHGKYIMGPEVKELEERLAAFVCVKHCIGCASGTDALLMALMAMDVGPGDAIFTTPFTFIAAAEVISLLGATPVFVDIDPKTFNIDPDKLELAIKALKTDDPSIYPLPSDFRPQTSDFSPKGIITVDLFGLPCDYDRINAIAKEQGLFVIEDAAQGFGGEYKGKKAGSLASIGCTSFFPAKPLACYGDGGAVFTDDDATADILGSIRVHGKGTHKYDNARIGLNARLDTLQAAVLNAKFDIFPQEIELRNQVASKYTKLLDPCSTLHAPCVPEGYKCAWAQYSLLSDKKDQIQSALKEKGIPTAAYYPKPLHLQTAFAYLRYKEGDMPASEDCSRQIFSLPMHPYLEDREIERICGIIRREISCRDTRRREGKGSQFKQTR